MRLYSCPEYDINGPYPTSRKSLCSTLKPCELGFDSCLCFSPLLNPPWSGHWALLTAFQDFPAQGSEPFSIPPAQFQKPVNDTAVIPLLTQVYVLNFISCCFSKYSNNSNKKRKGLFDPLLQVQAAAHHCWEVKVAGSRCGKSQPWSDAQFIQSTISCLVNGATHSEQFPSSIKIIKMIPHRPVPRLIWSR